VCKFQCTSLQVAGLEATSISWQSAGLIFGRKIDSGVIKGGWLGSPLQMMVFICFNLLMGKQGKTIYDGFSSKPRFIRVAKPGSSAHVPHVPCRGAVPCQASSGWFGFGGQPAVYLACHLGPWELRRDGWWIGVS
jgi:hypothetical protein